ncbi:MAG TPA: arsenic efflux protein [Candidatus Onthocola gallistercoris]|uniref:Arsenic efflux protein n=1 Tax=Candidatus Onthocola gallistercoris TaxID=2840876 RepID=A0A9D1HGU6_9FIRM|nr:arsenic efflux protein [Candidatus Onthocola gallistercoris]
MLHVIEHTLEESIRLLPFLLAAYILMEYVEHHMGDRTKRMIQTSGRFGPVIGSIAGIVPQCGFSAMAANLYSGGIITIGTLMAIFLSTSDEMLPVFLSQQAPLGLIAKILGMKVVIAAVVGFAVDFIWRKRYNHRREELHIHDMCEHEHCHCEDGILKSAVYHTVKIFVFILIVSFCLNLVIEWYGRDQLASLVLGQPVIGSVIAALVGLIPNCAASAIIAQLYLEGALTLGAMMSGLLAATGVGIVVLFKTNGSLRKNLTITVMLYGISVAAGWLIDMIGIFG